MTFDPLYGFVFAGLFSPGPNVILLTASGARFGFKRSIPHVLGVAAGVGITSGITGFGLGALLLAQPALTLALKLVAAGWILWMAWKLLNARGAAHSDGPDKPFTFVQAVLFQWVNPKVWAIAVAAAAGYGANGTPVAEAMRLATAFAGVNLGVCLFWSFAGSLLIFLLKTPKAWRLFTIVMALMLAFSAVMVFLPAR